MPNRPLNQLTVEVLTALDWQRFREIRLASLKADPDSFGGNFENAQAESQSDWVAKFDNYSPVVAVINGKDVGLLTIENLIGDFGTTCWIGGCWVDSSVRGRGIMRAIFNYIDQNANELGWTKQGLGVWQDNFSAIAIYEAIGFMSIGDPVPSTSRQGLFYQRMVREAPTK